MGKAEKGKACTFLRDCFFPEMTEAISGQLGSAFYFAIGNGVLAADGVVDADDRCPDEAGPTTNKGCPEIEEEVKDVLNLAMRAVQFETGSAVIKEESYTVLDQIADIMKRYPAYQLRISGHWCAHV